MAIRLRSRRMRHRLYVEARIHELHQKLFKEVIDEGTVDQLSRKLLLKYHSKLKKIE
jgi:hypothetical protein